MRFESALWNGTCFSSLLKCNLSVADQQRILLFFQGISNKDKLLPFHQTANWLIGSISKRRLASSGVSVYCSTDTSGLSCCTSFAHVQTLYFAFCPSQGGCWRRGILPAVQRHRLRPLHREPQHLRRLVADARRDRNPNHRWGTTRHLYSWW